MQKKLKLFIKSKMVNQKMQWQDEGIVISAKAWAEKYLLVTLFTNANGVQKGLLRQTKALSHLQVGTIVHCTWKARLSDHLGTFSIEVIDIPFVRLFSMPAHLLFLRATSSLLESTLPERHPYNTLYQDFLRMMKSLHVPSFHIYYEYAHFEFLLLKELGFGFDFSKCVLCNQEKDIYYVSPKTGRGACKACGDVHASKLFVFDAKLFQDEHVHQITQLHYQEAFFLSSHFLTRHVLLHSKTALPMIRAQFINSNISDVGLKTA